MQARAIRVTQSLARPQVRRAVGAAAGAGGGGAVIDGGRVFHQPHLAGRARASGGSAGGGSAHGVAKSHTRRAISPRRGRAASSSAQVISFPTAIFSGDLSQLAALNAVTAGYPLRGHLRIADAPFGPGRITDRIPGAGEVWVDSRIIAHLKLELGRNLAHRRGLVPRHRGARLPAGSGHRLRESRAGGAAQLRRSRRHAADSAGQPRQLRRAVRGQPGGGCRFPRISRCCESAGRTPAGCRGIQPAAQFRHRSRQPILESREPCLGAARGGGGGDGRATLRVAPHRCRRLDEMHGRRAGFRAVDFHHRTGPAGIVRGGRRDSCSATSRKSDWCGCCKVSSATSSPQPRWRRCRSRW